jgi:5-methylcytosine-specific restriction protein B
MPEEKVRGGLLLEQALKILDVENRPMRPAAVLNELHATVKLNDRELSENRSRVPRYRTQVMFFSGQAKDIGWLRKANGMWELTEAGRDALHKHRDPDELYRAMGRRYRLYYKNKKAIATLDELIPNIPGDRAVDPFELARLLDIPLDEAENLLTERDVRITTSADMAHLPSAELERLVEQASNHRNTSQRAWLVRQSKSRDASVQQWLEEGICAYSASRLPTARTGMPLAQLKELVDQYYDYLSYSARRDLAAEVHHFLNRMQINDIVVTNDDKQFYLGFITSPVETSPGDQFVRQVEWRSVDEPIDYADLPAVLKARASAQGNVIELTAELDTLFALLTDRPALDMNDDEELVLSSPQPELVMDRPIELKAATEEFAEAVLLEQEWLQHEVIDLLYHRKQLILHGPPGTGKTFLAQKIAHHLTDPENVKLVQFHPAYSYEDFFEGIRPKVSSADGEESAGFVLTPGPLRRLVDAAENNKDTPHILIIDEINRANLPKVFGELYFLLEYRQARITPLYAADANAEFYLPDNVFFIGTMNTTDRSIASMDAAIRRRFAFVELHPNEPPVKDLLHRWLEREGHDTEIATLLDALNRQIPERELQLGPSYLMRPEVHIEGGLERAWRSSIMPLLEEYYFGTQFDVRARFGLDAIRLSINPDTTP